MIEQHHINEINRHLKIARHLEDHPEAYTYEAHAKLHKNARKLFETVLSTQEDVAERFDADFDKHFPP